MKNKEERTENTRAPAVAEMGDRFATIDMA